MNNKNVVPDVMMSALKGMVIMLMESKGGGANIASVLSVQVIRDANWLENRYGSNAG